MPIFPTDVLYDIFDKRYNFAFRGIWDITASYAPGDVVEYGTFTYRAIVPNSGIMPTNGSIWAIRVDMPSMDGVVTLANSAANSADQAAASAVTAHNSAVETSAIVADQTAALVDFGARVSAVEVGQAGAVIGYATKALLTADLAPVDKTVAYVTNDATPANNGTYRKNGATGAGTWVQASFDRLAVNEGRTTITEGDILSLQNGQLELSESNGTPSALYNTATLSGWGSIVKTSLSNIKSITIKKDANKSFTHPSFNVQLMELSGIVPADIATGTVIQTWSVAVTDWNKLAVGGDFTLSLSNIYTPSPGKYYLIRVYSEYSTFDWLNIRQTGLFGGVHTENANFMTGIYRIAYTDPWLQTSVDNYGLWVGINSDIAQELVTQKVINNDLKNATYASEPNGLPGFNYLDNTLNGWGAIVSTGLAKIERVVIQKLVHGSVSYAHPTLKLSLWEISGVSAADVDSGTLIHSMDISTTIWNTLANGTDVEMILPTPYQPKSGKFYAVGLTTPYTGSLDLVNPMQTGDSNPIGATFKKGLFKATNTSGWTYANGTASASYGLYVRLEQSLDSCAKDTLPLINISNNYFHNLTLGDNPLKECPAFNQHFLQRDKDMYVVLWGDSITAWPSSPDKAEEGVTQVPPVCERKALANRIWNAVKFGHPLYRRFDHGKNALVGPWDSTWATSDSPFFAEVGTFGTYYFSGTVVPDSNPSYTTNVTAGACPVGAFHETEAQRSIPKRLSGSANASVSFVIPAGYLKADFIYHTHTQGDDQVTITISGGAGKMLVKDTNVDWSTAVEAHNHVFSMRENHGTGDDGYDSGILQARIHFKKVTITDTITVTITKSANTSKYLLYWGATYWGTTNEPNALHLIDTGRGGHTIDSLISRRIYDVARWNPDLLIFEHTLLNNAGGTADNPAAYANSLGTLITYINSLSLDWFTILPHPSTTLINNSPDKLRIYWNYAKWACINAGVPVVDVERVFYKIWQFQNPNQEMSYSAFTGLRMFDGSTHPNTLGFDIFEMLIKPIFDQI